ncbi:hypothetical protein B0H19DRAFT_1081246 [Mycena capillaripes]|nr:hypothetical protein B0H19DRAFT_1081246 [Mycena capillaripes]
MCDSLVQVRGEMCNQSIKLAVKPPVQSPMLSFKLFVKIVSERQDKKYNQWERFKYWDHPSKMVSSINVNRERITSAGGPSTLVPSSSPQLPDTNTSETSLPCFYGYNKLTRSCQPRGKTQTFHIHWESNLSPPLMLHKPGAYWNFVLCSDQSSDYERSNRLCLIDRMIGEPGWHFADILSNCKVRLAWNSLPAGLNTVYTKYPSLEVNPDLTILPTAGATAEVN